uniref:Centromere/kinetochore protein zw10 homolog n=1 Tax=Clastoptera arizonana TaxID=38151 RepID=A0A1B6DLN4_9HEMI
MSNFISEVLATADEMELVELSSRMKNCNSEVSNLKTEVKNCLKKKYVEYLPIFTKNKDLVNEATLLGEEIDNLKNTIDNQIKRKSTTEVKTLSTALQENAISISVVSLLLQLDKLLNKAKQDQNSGRFVEAAQTLNKIETLLQENQEDIEYLDIYEGIDNEFTKFQAKCTVDLMSKWKKYITWTEEKIDKHKTKRLLMIDVNMNKENIKALYYHHQLIIDLSVFSEKFFKDVLCNIMTNESIVEEDKETLTVISNCAVKDQSCPNILHNLIVVLNFLNLKLNVDLGDGESVMKLIANLISKDFLQCLVKNCLSNSIPRRREEFDRHHDIAKEIINFNNYLLEIGFIEEGNNCILDYSKNIDLLFAVKTCQNYIELARTIMKKDLSNMFEESTQEIKLEAPDETVILSELPESFFQFPRCQVSTSAKEFLYLVHEILEELCNSRGSLAINLFNLSRNILKMYSAVVPEYHKQILSTIPQQSALLHNNCMYLAHNLTTLGTDLRKKLSNNKDLNLQMITFIDIVPVLQEQGAKVMREQLVTQSKILVDIIGDSGLVTLSDNPQFPKGVEKAVRQCLRQLALLQKVWQHVLPVNVYCKIIGQLCNTLLEEIISKVLTAKDIPEDASTQLVYVFKIIQEKSPLLFTEPKEIHQHVIIWHKFNELVYLLQASLLQIEDRWSDGKGPLALEFKAEQVKQMVRALFQISDKRSVLLAKIK